MVSVVAVHSYVPVASVVADAFVADLFYFVSVVAVAALTPLSRGGASDIAEE